MVSKNVGATIYKNIYFNYNQNIENNDQHNIDRI